MVPDLFLLFFTSVGFWFCTKLVFGGYLAGPKHYLLQCSKVKKKCYVENKFSAASVLILGVNLVWHQTLYSWLVDSVQNEPALNSKMTTSGGEQLLKLLQQLMHLIGVWQR